MAKEQAKKRVLRWKRKRVAQIPGYSSESDVAGELGVSVRTLRKWRQLGEGPPYVQIARQVHYPDAPRAAWLRGKEKMPVRSGHAHGAA